MRIFMHPTQPISIKNLAEDVKTQQRPSLMHDWPNSGIWYTFLTEASFDSSQDLAKPKMDDGESSVGLCPRK